MTRLGLIAVACLAAACGQPSANGEDNGSTDAEETGSSDSSTSTSTSTSDTDETTTDGTAETDSSDTSDTTDTGDGPCEDIYEVPNERTEWRMEFDAGGNDGPGAVAFLNDGTAIVVGSSEVDPEADIFVAAHSSDGEQLWLWTKDIDGYDSGLAVRRTQDGGFLLGGVVGGGDSSVWIAKYDSGGSLIWETELDSPAGGDSYAVDSFIDLHELASGDVAVTGATSWAWGEGEDATIGWVLSLSNAGADTEIIWSEQDGPSLTRSALTVDENFLLGFSQPPDALIRQIDGQGNQVWDATINERDRDEVPCMVSREDHSVFWAGGARDGTKETLDGFVGNLSAEGELEWSEAQGYCGMDYFDAAVSVSSDVFVALQIHADNPGDTTSVSGAFRMMSDSGQELWAERLPNVDDGRPTGFAVSPDGYAFVVGLAGTKDAYDYFITRIALD